jgi:hypothetical protein
LTANNITTGDSWSGVSVRSGASASVERFDMSNNSGVEFGVSVSSTNSLLTVRDSRFTLNQGTVCDLSWSLPESKFHS